MTQHHFHSSQMLVQSFRPVSTVSLACVLMPFRMFSCKVYLGTGQTGRELSEKVSSMTIETDEAEVGECARMAKEPVDFLAYVSQIIHTDEPFILDHL